LLFPFRCRPRALMPRRFKEHTAYEGRSARLALQPLGPCNGGACTRKMRPAALDNWRIGSPPALRDDAVQFAHGGKHRACLFPCGGLVRKLAFKLRDGINKFVEPLVWSRVHLDALVCKPLRLRVGLTLHFTKFKERGVWRGASF